MKEHCEHCGTVIIYNCMVCGAPACCPKCCYETTLEFIMEEARRLAGNEAEMERENI